MIGRRVILRLLTGAGDVRPVLDARDVPPSARVSLIAAYRDDDAVDAVAGSEYVDDRIRLRE
jgi:hypothetical protein